MRKIISMMWFLLLLVGGVSAYTITTTGGISTPVLVPSSVGTGQAVYMAVDQINYGVTPNYESRIAITASEVKSGLTLGDVDSIRWDYYQITGYVPHVDIKLDINNDGIYDNTNDDALVIEYDKVATPSDQALGTMNFTKNAWTNTFDSKGVLNNNARIWLNSGDAGDLTAPNFVDAKLSEWKTGNAGTNLNSGASPSLIAMADKINSTTKIYSFEFEIDGWIDGAIAYMDNINFTLTGGISRKLTFESNNESSVSAIVIETLDGIGITILTDLDFGTVLSGYNSTKKNIDFAVHKQEGKDVNITITTDNIFYQKSLYLNDNPYYQWSSDSISGITGTATAQLINIPKGYEGTNIGDMTMWIREI